MKSTPTIDWASYYENTKNYPPSGLLIKALEYVKFKNIALDIGGGGTLKDTKYLLSLGFETTVVDKEEAVAVAARQIKSDKLKFFITEFVDFTFPSNHYDIASAIYSLPFNAPEDFDTVFEKVKKSLVKGGIFCGQFFGNNDSWHKRNHITFFTKVELMARLTDVEIIWLEEKEFDGKTADGSPKHWHVFDVIGRKK